MFLAPAQCHTHSWQLFSVCHRKKLYSTRFLPCSGTQDHRELRSCLLCDLSLDSLSLWVSQSSYQSLEAAASPSTPGHHVQKALAGAGRHRPVLFSSPQTWLFLISRQLATHGRPLGACLLSGSLLFPGSSWEHPPLWPRILLIGTMVSKQRSKSQNSVKLDRAAGRSGAPLWTRKNACFRIWETPVP